MNGLFFGQLNGMIITSCSRDRYEHRIAEWFNYIVMSVFVQNRRKNDCVRCPAVQRHGFDALKGVEQWRIFSRKKNFSNQTFDSRQFAQQTTTKKAREMNRNCRYDFSQSNQLNFYSGIRNTKKPNQTFYNSRLNCQWCKVIIIFQ